FKFFQSKDKNKADKWSTKEKFIIKLLETIILDIWIYVGRHKLNSNLDFIEEINSISFKQDNFDTRLEYLLQVLKLIFDILKPIQLMEQTVYNLDF
ncbi:hypothetical protein V7139_28700, partial [Neobacillus drentensis]